MSVAESNKGVHTVRMWHKEMGRWHGHRRSFKLQTVAGQMLSGRWFSARVPCKSPIWMETLPEVPWDFLHLRGGFTSHLSESYSHLLLLKGKSSPLILASKKETWAVFPPSQWLMEASRGACDSLAAQDDGKHSAYSTPVLLPTESTPQALPQVQTLFNPQSTSKSKTLFLFSDYFKMSIYFTVLNTGTKQEEYLKPFILQHMKIKTKVPEWSISISGHWKYPHKKSIFMRASMYLKRTWNIPMFQSSPTFLLSFPIVSFTLSTDPLPCNTYPK